jgi:hypothetical protein
MPDYFLWMNNLKSTLHGDSRSNGSFCIYVPKLIMLRILSLSTFALLFVSDENSSLFLLCIVTLWKKPMMIRLMPNQNFRIGSSILVCLSNENFAINLEVLRSRSMCSKQIKPVYTFAVLGFWLVALGAKSPATCRSGTYYY